MNIEINKKVNTVSATVQSTSKTNGSDGNFAAELKSLKEETKTQKTDSAKADKKQENTVDKTSEKQTKPVEKTEKTEKTENETNSQTNELKTDKSAQEKVNPSEEISKANVTEEGITENDLKIGEVAKVGEIDEPIIDEDFIPEFKKPTVNIKPEFDEIELSPEQDIIEKEEVVVQKLEDNKNENIIPKEKETPKVDVKQDALVSITKPDFEPEIDDSNMKSEKTAKHEKPQQKEIETKPEKQKENDFKNIIEADGVKEEPEFKENKIAKKPDVVNIDESIIETTKVISGLEDAVKEMKKINRPNEKSENDIKKDDISTDKQEKTIINQEKVVTDFDVNKSKSEKPEIEKPILEKPEFKKPEIEKSVTEKPKTEKHKTEDEVLIDNNINIQDVSEKTLPQMNTNMNFNAESQPFSDFVTPKKEELKSNKKDLAEEQAILSTMAENIAIANQNMLNIKPEENVVKETNKKPQVKPTKPVETILQTVLQDEPDEVQEVQSKTKTVTTDEGVKKVDRKTNVVVETVVKYDSVIMDEADVEFFTKLVNEGTVDMSEVKNAEKSSRVSKSLADLLAKAMQDNKPVRIDFDNNISVIIKIGKDGKISADFLPSSQVAEAYLKENLPLLKQKLDDNNIEYDELNQRKQKQDNQENRKKGRKDE